MELDGAEQVLPVNGELLVTHNRDGIKKKDRRTGPHIKLQGDYFIASIFLL